MFVKSWLEKHEMELEHEIFRRFMMITQSLHKISEDDALICALNRFKQHKDKLFAKLEKITQNSWIITTCISAVKNSAQDFASSVMKL